MLKTFISRCLTATLLLASTTAAHAVSLSLNDKGIGVDGATMGKFTLEYPALIMPDGKATPKVAETKIAGQSAVVRYENVGQIDVALQEGGKVALSFPV